MFENVTRCTVALLGCFALVGEAIGADGEVTITNTGTFDVRIHYDRPGDSNPNFVSSLGGSPTSVDLTPGQAVTLQRGSEPTGHTYTFWATASFSDVQSYSIGTSGMDDDSTASWSVTDTDLPYVRNTDVTIINSSGETLTQIRVKNGSGGIFAQSTSMADGTTQVISASPASTWIGANLSDFRVQVLGGSGYIEERDTNDPYTFGQSVQTVEVTGYDPVTYLLTWETVSAGTAVYSDTFRVENDKAVPQVMNYSITFPGDEYADMDDTVYLEPGEFLDVTMESDAPWNYSIGEESLSDTGEVETVIAGTGSVVDSELDSEWTANEVTTSTGPEFTGVTETAAPPVATGSRDVVADLADLDANAEARQQELMEFLEDQQEAELNQVGFLTRMVSEQFAFLVGTNNFTPTMDGMDGDALGLTSTNGWATTGLLGSAEAWTATAPTITLPLATLPGGFSDYTMDFEQFEDERNTFHSLIKALMVLAYIYGSFKAFASMLGVHSLGDKNL